jgi:hypothetical protein
LKAGGDLKLLVEFLHPAPGAPVAQDAPQDHRSIAMLQHHLEQRPAHRGLHGLVEIEGHHIEGADQQAAVRGSSAAGW